MLDGRALLSARYFANTFKDLITFVSGPGPNFQYMQETESSVMEARFQVLLPCQLWLDGSSTFLKTKVIEDEGIGGTFFPSGQPLLRRHKYQRGVGLTYLGERTAVALTADIVGAAIRVTLPGHTKIDLAASYLVALNVWGIKDLRLQGKIENLLDEAYDEAFAFSAPRISVRGGITTNF